MFCLTQLELFSKVSCIAFGITFSLLLQKIAIGYFEVQKVSRRGKKRKQFTETADTDATASVGLD